MSAKHKIVKRDLLLGILKDRQEQDGCVSEAAIEAVALEMGLSASEVFGVASFYHFLSINEPYGRHVIRVCKSLPCHMAGSGRVQDWIGSELGIAPGQTTADGRFSFELVNCIGACDEAPAMLIDDTVYGSLSAEKVAQILKALD